MFHKLEKFNKNKKIIVDNDRILACVSGGADSVFLIYFFEYLKKNINFQYGICHFNHNLRDNAKRDENFVTNIAEKFKVDFYLGNGDVEKVANSSKKSIEMVARELRYDFFQKISLKNNFNKISVAHNLTDSIETTFINMVRGSGIRGLTGIKTNYGNIIRPLLCVTSKEIRDFLASEKIEFVEDETNKSEVYLRNKVRKYIIPSFEKTFGNNYEFNLIKTINQLNEYRENSEKLLSYYLKDKYFIKGNCLRIKKEILTNMEYSLLKETIIYLIEKLNKFTYYLTKNLINSFCQFVKGEGYSKYYPSEKLNITFERGSSEFFIYVGKIENKSEILSSNKLYEVFPGVKLFLKKNNNLKLNKDKSNCFFKKDERITISPLDEGDFIVFKGKKRYNVNKLMKKYCVGAFMRKHFPLLKRDNEILWIPFVLYSDKIREHVKRENLIEVYMEDLLR